MTFNWPKMTLRLPYLRSVSSNTPQKTPSDQPKFCVRSKQTPTRLGTDIETGKMTPPDPVKDHDGITLHQTRPEHHVVSNESGHVIENNGNDPKQPVQKRRQLTITLPNISKQNTVWVKGTQNTVWRYLIFQVELLRSHREIKISQINYTLKIRNFELIISGSDQKN